MVADAVNDFIKVSIDNQAYTRSITFSFFNQPSESVKFYSVRYGPECPGCKHLPMQVKGHLSHSNSITVDLNNINPSDTLICLDIIVTNGSKTISLDGIYTVGKYIP